ncbi:hypothetical protein ABZ934_29190 [Streptomyces sp. NPDC046557]|uniref:hypothetical protein n=1 Tax=Streptomyces sp. NPDC046557 TaxID=3155372 RepID=UPI0033FE1675
MVGRERLRRVFGRVLRRLVLRVLVVVRFLGRFLLRWRRMRIQLRIGTAGTA